MSFSFISKISLYLSLIFIISCQDTILSIDKKVSTDLVDKNLKYETLELIDLGFIESHEKNSIDIYTVQNSNYNFLDKNQKKIKINNFEKKYNINTPINIIKYDQNFYSINAKGQLVKFDIETGKLLERFTIELDEVILEPVSFSLYENDFIVGFKSGIVARINNIGKVIWLFNKMNLLNTPIKIFNENLIVSYPEQIVFLDPNSGNIIYEKKFISSNIIQSSGGKIKNYYNIIFFILSNSIFNALDTFLFEEHFLNFDQIEINTSLNNLKDQIYVYKNFLVYLDDGNIIHTYDINTDEFILSNFRINNSSSIIFLNNFLISKTENFIYLYNIKTGKLFSKVDISKFLNKKSKIISALIIKNKLHFFSDDGKIIILDQNLNIEKTINLKIKNINQIYSYQNKIFISTEKGITYIY